MSRFINSYINDFGIAAGIGDLSNVDYNKDANIYLEILDPIRDIFCDNVVVWCPCDASKIKSGIPSHIQSYYNNIRDVFNSIGILSFGVKIFLAEK